ncbi:imidazole glycerol phosphate synthase subunit HisF [Buchnera aphidicola (Thelaxes californica)]|uniref:imidazole glycerol-phosphate synthase n=1 Tax=Buchnera aphidicola (Thelaxes californica) TaxID=1315998 RepID=A0A4D6YF12_9GAMM|nr:imidazole glycerol phosphate synthase subunit HisF [Buchnera aphidicola]QCI26643.1 imidazole glycerol phosphate synthase subunit HisF [Buchnera aphidicola (Thelaxes californica)]
MLAKRIIPCLDVKDGIVVKGIQFKNHQKIGNILKLAKKYADNGADELVFYDITASSNNTLLNKKWVEQVAELINIPFCVAGGIKNIKEARTMLSLGADKISINSPAIHDPFLISRLADTFGVQCVVVGIDSWYNTINKQYHVFQYTGIQEKMIQTSLYTDEWVEKVQQLGAGEIVLNVMNEDGNQNGYDVKQLTYIRNLCHVPLIASGGAGKKEDFYHVFNIAKVDGALAASVFHKNIINILDLKQFLFKNNIEVRLC